MIFIYLYFVSVSNRSPYFCCTRNGNDTFDYA